VEAAEPSLKTDAANGPSADILRGERQAPGPVPAVIGTVLLSLPGAVDYRWSNKHKRARAGKSDEQSSSLTAHSRLHAAGSRAGGLLGADAHTGLLPIS
jgi:hypothetical protein